MVVEELFSRSSEMICFQSKEKQVYMRCSMMDALFPGIVFATDGVMVQVAPDRFVTPSLFVSDTTYEYKKQILKMVGVASCFPIYWQK